MISLKLNIEEIVYILVTIFKCFVVKISGNFCKSFEINAFHYLPGLSIQKCFAAANPLNAGLHP